MTNSPDLAPGVRRASALRAPALPLALLLGVPLTLASPAIAQGSGSEFAGTPATNLDRELAGWRAQHGDSWHARVNRRTGTLELLFGGNAAPSFEPDTNIEEDWFRLGREAIAATQRMHGVDGAELVDARFVFLPLGQGTTTDKITVRFDQVIGGVPVEDGRVNALFDTQGRLLSLHTTAAPAVERRGVRPAFDGGFAGLVAREAFAGSEGFEPNHYGTPELVYAWVDDEEARRWTLAWQVDAQHVEDGFTPRGWLYTIDALTGQVLKRAASVHFFDVTGTVVSNASPGTSADHAGNPPAQLPMPHIRVQTSAGTVFTDENGVFTLPGVNVPVDVTLRYSGQFTNVNNNAGSAYTVTIPGVQPNQPNTLVMNPSPTEYVTSQANGFRHVNVQRDWIRSIIPTDGTADFLSTTNVNQNDTCNAFYNGSSTNYFRRGGSCNNTAFSAVVAHEMGHWLNSRYGTGNGNDGMGEGNADVFSCFMYDDPIMGRFFSTNGGSVRNANNTRQYCGDGNGGCYGQVHRDGEVWMGAAWKVRTRLNSSLGNTVGDLTSNLLFLGWMNAYSQMTIDSIIELQWLTLDDDDGNINNGTPNYDEIDGGFMQQGFPGFALPYVTFAGVVDLPDTTDEAGPYVVRADILANINPPVAAATLVYRVNGGAAQSVPMVNVGGDTFEAGIPGQASPAFVEYYVEGADAQNNTNQFPSDNLNEGLAFAVGQIVAVQVTDFESGAAGWTNGGGTATTGQWERGNPQGTAAQSEDDHTPDPGVNCWATGLAAGTSLGSFDIDGGETILLSPVYDMSGLSNVRASYWRWYSNSEGNSPNADTFTIEISNNGGTTWQLVERVGPGGPEADGDWYRHSFIVDSIVQPTATVRLRFRASDLGNGSIVEAAIDDVEIVAVVSTIPAPEVYCTTTPNSTGQPGQIGFAGSQRISDNTAQLTGQNFPPASFGLYFFGDTQVQAPIAGQQGVLCVAGTTFRLPIIQTDTLFGTVGYPLDFTDPTTNAQVIAPGSTWNFQFWHRDSVGGVATSNTSPGLQVEFGQ